tara:strand:+ start:575 stop:1057 length:483 start_codon:yes stop_codon:yes gene_type:complete
MLDVVLLSCMALVTFNVSAQTQNVPVSCNWVQTGSQAGQSAATITFQCKESNGNVAATRRLTYSAPSWQVTQCTISLASDVFNSGTCQNESLYRKEIIVSPCKNSGTYIASGCANSMTSSAGFGAEVVRLCGAASCVTYQNLGAINGCYRESPFLKAYCK